MKLFRGERVGFRWLGLVVALVLVMPMLPVPMVQAALDSCSVSLSPTSVAPNSDTGFSFGIYNGNASPISWLEFTRPAGDYLALENGSASGWDATVGSDTVTFVDGSLNTGFSQSFNVQAKARGTDGGPVSWTVKASDNPDGSGAITCDGDMSLTIATQPSTITISNVRISNVGSASVTVLWDTDVASTSSVAYGQDASYGSQSPIDNQLVTSHSVRLTGLKANTGYHYIVSSTTPADGGAASSPDSTFLTAEQGQAVVVEVPVPSSQQTILAPIGPATESTPPSVSWTSRIAKVYKTAPTLTGEAADNVAVAKIEYSVDGGKNWLAVDKVAPTSVTSGTGKKKTVTVSNAKVGFEFTPVMIEDGNYDVVVRATDSSGNQATSTVATVVIDRLPPRFGASVVTAGPQVIAPDVAGVLVLPVGVDAKITTSLIGGPVTATIRAQVGMEPGQTFTLRRASESGLWGGLLSFRKAGRYHLTGEAVDGVGNRTSRVLATVEVVPPVRVVGSGSQLKDAVVTLYYLNPEDHSWSIWDGPPYGQRNPQPLKGQRDFSLLVPSGEYYMKVAVPGAADTLTRSFKLDRPTPLTGVIQLGERAKLKLGPVTLPLPWTSLVAPPVQTVAVKSTSPVVNSRLPLVSLPTTTGRTVSPVDWYGKPTVVAVVVTWAPATTEQLGPLAELQTNTDVNVVMLAEQQQTETVAAYLRVAQRSAEAVADPDGLLSDTLAAPGTPTLYLMDRHGIIKKVMVGIHTTDELLTELSRL
jgi:hypothetical protein